MPKHSPKSRLCLSTILTGSLMLSSFPQTQARIVFRGSDSSVSLAKDSIAPARAAATPPATVAPPVAPPLAPPVTPEAVSITATNRDSGWPNFPNPASPGDTVTYTVVITNSGPNDATGVNFTDIVNGSTSTLA